MTHMKTQNFVTSVEFVRKNFGKYLKFGLLQPPGEDTSQSFNGRG